MLFLWVVEKCPGGGNLSVDEAVDSYDVADAFRFWRYLPVLEVAAPPCLKRWTYGAVGAL